MNASKFVKTLVIMLLLLVCTRETSVRANNADSYIVKFRENTPITYSESYVPLIPDKGIYAVEDISLVDLSQCEYIEQNEIFELHETYDYSKYEKIPEISSTNITDMWESGIYGTNVKVGIIDSGCNRHYGFGQSNIIGHNYIDGSDDISDNIGHGTSVSGIIGTRYGLIQNIGFAFKADIVALKFIDRDSIGTRGGTLTEMISAIVNGVDIYNCDILNISAGIKSNRQSLQDAIDYATEKGAVIIASAGNDGSNTLYYPAAYNNVIGVGAVNSDNEHANFSNHNDSVFVVAPGVDVTILQAFDSTSKGSGTSYSTPCVAGIVATMKQFRPTIDVQDVKDILKRTSTDLGDEGHDDLFGWGLIDASAIMFYMLQDEDYYISDIDICDVDGSAEVRIRKMKSDIGNPIGIWGEYEQGILYNVKVCDTYYTDNISVLRYKKTDNTILRCFVWESWETMRPVLKGEKR